MTEPLQKCDNCLKEFPQSKIATHFSYCRRNIKRCTQCGEMFDINYKEQHEEQFHKKVACQFCKKQFGVAEVQKHKNSCALRTKFCEYCELNVPINQFSTHLKACQSRTKNCDKCKKPITNKDYLVHTVTCKGVVEQPNSYDQYLKNQREREQARQQSARVQNNKPADKVGFDMGKRAVPSSGSSNGIGITSNYGNASKPTVPASTSPHNYQPRPIVTNIGSNAANIANNARVQPKPPTYNQREVISNVQPKQQIGIKNYQYGNYSNKNQVKYQHKNQTRDPKYDQKIQHRSDNRINPPTQNYGVYKNQVIKPDIKYDARDGKQRNDGRLGSRNKITQNRTGSNDNYKPGTGSNNRIQIKHDYKYESRNDPKRNQVVHSNYGISRPAQNIKKQVPPSSQYQYNNNPYSYKNEPTKVPTQPPPQIPSSNYNKVKKQPIKKQERVLAFDPRDYGGYSDDIPQELLENNYNSNTRAHEQDEMYQRAILQSMSQNTKKVPASKKGIPKQLDHPQLMQTSFYRDYCDEEKQKAIYEQIQTNAKKNKR